MNTEEKTFVQDLERQASLHRASDVFCVYIFILEVLKGEDMLGSLKLQGIGDLFSITGAILETEMGATVTLRAHLIEAVNVKHCRLVHSRESSCW